jgi:transcriptional regulator with XRE-family HTH domain
MAKLTLSALGKLVRDKRGERRLRDTAKDVGISAATLMRIESGRVPDVETFGKVCRWLGIDPGDFLGFNAPGEPRKAPKTSATPAVQVSAHFRIDRLPLPETANALARMLLFVAQREAAGEFSDADA